MSSLTNATLEEFVKDATRNVTPEQIAALIALLEPDREAIESELETFLSEDSWNWRDYRNALWDSYVHSRPDIQTKAQEILARKE